MQPPRPSFLNLLAIRLPIGGIASILHRGSGVLLALAIPALLYGLMLSLRSPEDFRRLSDWAGGSLGKLLILVGVWALAHHFLAGLRHLGFDLGWGETRNTSRLTAWLSIVLALAVAGLAATGMLA